MYGMYGMYTYIIYDMYDMYNTMYVCTYVRTYVGMVM